MIPARRWRGLALGAVAVADVVVTIVIALAGPDLLVFVIPLLLALTVRTAFAPEGWAPHGLVFTQMGAYAMAVTSPRAGLDWAAAVLVALAVLATHLAVSLLSAWPPRAGLPTPTASRTLVAFAALGGVAVVAGLVAALVGTTPDTWAAWLVPVAVVALGALLLVLRGPYLRGIPRRR